jgi:hypothetical protein
VQQLPPLPPLPALTVPDARDKLYRDGFVEQWMARSDLLCREYKDKIILVSRSTRFATDATSTILSGLATIFTAIGTIHPLTGAATIVSGVGAASQTDNFEQQSGEIIASAVQTARERQANQIEYNLKTYGPADYSIYRAQRDVIEYHNMCSLETAMSQIRSSLKATSPNKGETPPAAQGDVRLAPVQSPVTASPSGLSGPPGQGIGTGGGTGTGNVTLPPIKPPPITGRGAVVINEGPPASDRIASAIGDAEIKISKEMGRRIQSGLCLVPDKESVKFGPAAREAIVLFRQTSEAKNLGAGARSSGGLSADEASYLANHKCDTPCYKNAYEYYEFGANSSTKQSKLQNLAAKLKNVKPSLELPKEPLQELCQLRPAISEVQRTDAFSQWKDSNGTLDIDFVNKLPPPFKATD